MTTSPVTWLTLLAASTVATATTFYVSPQGDDAHAGTGPAPAQALRTVQAGVDRAQPGDTVQLRGGIYRETVNFPRSGTADQPITIEPYQNEEATISGCDPVTGWTKGDGNVWTAPLPWTLGAGRNQVFVNGEVMIEARFPNEPSPGLGMYVSDLSPLWPTFGDFSIENPKENPARIVSPLLEGQPDGCWKGGLYYGVHFEGWAAQTGTIESSKSGEIIVGDRTRGWWFGSAYGGNYKPEEGRGMITGCLQALDAPGEWILQDNLLHLIPKTPGQPANVEAKARQLACDLSGRQHLQLKRLKIRAASLRLEDSAWCLVDGCDIAYVSHYSKHYGTGQIEDGRDTIKSGETGIFVGGHDNQFLNCSVRYSAGAGFYLRGYHHTIHNCLIDQISYVAHYLNAITDAVGDYNDYENFLVGGHVITFNTMRNAGRHFFNFYGNGTSVASRDRGPMDYMATLFAHNHLYNGMLQTKDAGFLTGYYSSGGTLDGLNSQVVYNAIHDSYDIFAMRIHKLGLVYLDAGSCDVDLHHNLLWAAPGSLQRGLWYNTMCVDVHEHDNTFHPDFTRTSAELKPSDFPEAKPFRFGHDFPHPPAVPTWPQLDRQQLRLTMPAAGLVDGSVVDLGEVDFGQGWQSAVLRWASAVKELNTDRSARARPRHHHQTDPLVLEVAANDELSEGVRRQWTFMYNIADGAWAKFSGVPLGEGFRRFRVVYGNDQPTPRTVEVHLDAVDGPLVGTVELPQTDRARGGRIQIYQMATGAISPAATGTHDVYLVFHSPDDQPAGEFEYFRFEQSRGAIPLRPNEVKFELRAGSPTGEKLGEFYPRSTGAADNFRLMVAKLEPARGRQHLFLTVRAAAEGQLGTAEWVRLEQAHQPIDWTGVGVPPRTEGGRLVFPAQTNRPCARPADNYPAGGTASGPRPIAVAMLLKQAPTIDGRLDEWPTDDASQTLQLAQNFDGNPSPTTPSQAWLGYDSEALYVAARHPVKNAPGLHTSSHEWGAVDGVEVAFQDATSKQRGAILTLYGYPDGQFTSENFGGATPTQLKALTTAVTYRAQVAADAWSCEWRIPFAATGLNPATVPLWAFNLGVRKTSPDGWTIWRGTGGATYQVGSGGLLVFPHEMLQLGLPSDKLLVHLDAADPAAVATDDDGLVSLWRDTSGQGHDAAQPDAKYRPALRPGALNGRSVLAFDEARRTRLELGDLSDQKLTATVFAVVSNPVAGSEVNHDPRIFTSSDGKAFDYLVGIAATVKGLETGGPRILTSGFVDRWAKVARVGCFSPNHQTFFTGDIAELVVYQRAVQLPEQERIRAYLTAKWGLDPTP